jgi:hypothetical protein
MKLCGAVLVAQPMVRGTAGWGFHLQEGTRHATRHPVYDPFKAGVKLRRG